MTATITTITLTVRTTMSDASLYRLLAWMSPSFPVGAYTYSHGLEWAVEEGTVTDAATLKAWVSDVLRYGSGRSDAILLARAFEAFSAGDLHACREIAELSAALQPSKERHLEASAQGAAFVTALEAAWPTGDAEAAERLAALKQADGPARISTWTYCIAVGIHCAAQEVDLAQAVSAYLHAFAANLVSAAVRSVPLGQSDGQRVIAGLEATIADVAAEALAAPLDDVGSACFLADISSQLHETQYTRLFRS
ncbi:urease accessory protein [Breoghania corrubedonensis]|uniref:Urease accessory protein UreF n=1 Tax=Breoghania corrubedonensis TaxID=665038 RepID=A0A2T5VIJ1_9HYPH|nr:urease accessory protein UreF [Breoghania corrubedonensis]PTW63528.1 urease accessory protein [Breoghania corrubedonensis]